MEIRFPPFFDNPGCIEVIMEWIKDNLSSEQTELLKNFIEMEKE